jgi:hypothetical protein
MADSIPSLLLSASHFKWQAVLARPYIRAVIGEYFDDKFGKDTFSQFDDEYPVVRLGRYCSPRH